MMHVKKDSTNVSIPFNIVDSVTGAAETGVTISTLTASYARPGSAKVSATLTALAAVTTAHTDNYGIALHDTTHPGVIRVDFPDAAFATGVSWVVCTITGSGFAPASVVVWLDPVPADITHVAGAAAAASAGAIDANVVSINDATVGGDGSVGDPWGPA